MALFLQGEGHFAILSLFTRFPNGLLFPSLEGEIFLSTCTVNPQIIMKISSFVWRSSLLWLLIAIGSSSLSLAQTLNIRGTITDAATGESLTGATVAIKSLNQGTFTDGNGSYRLEVPLDAAQGKKLSISYTGYALQQYEIGSTNESELVVTLALEPEDFLADDVVITATKGFEQSQSDLTVSVEIMKSKAVDLQAVPSVNKVISQIPGVDNQGGQINIRGSSGYAYGVGSRVMVTLDGLPLLTGDAGSANLDLIPVDNISQIEVMKGASSVLYGSSALGGVINIITADPGTKPTTSIRVRGGLFDSPANPILDWDGDANAQSFSAHLFHSRRLVSEKVGSLDLTLQSNFIKETGYRQGTDAEEYRNLLMLKFRPKAIPGLTVGLNASLTVDSSASILYWHSYYPGMLLAPGSRDSIYSGGALTPTPDAGGYRRQLGVVMAIDPTVKYLTQNGKHLFWYRGRLLRNKYDNDTDQSSNNSIFYHDFLYQTSLGKQINWVSGITYSQAAVRGDSLFGGVYVLEGDTIASDGRHTGNSLGIYTQLDGKFGRLNASLGVRYERAQINDLTPEDQPIVRLGLNYKIAEGTNVRTSFGQAFRVPSVAERFANTAGGGVVIEPNPSILSERGYSAEVAIRQGFLASGGKVKWKGFLDFAAFTMRYDDMVEFGVSKVGFNATGLDVRFSSINLADAQINGLELTSLVAADWGKGFASLSGGITLIDPKDLNAVPDSVQLDLVNFPVDILNPNKTDRPEFLKYRSKWTGRVSGSVGQGPVSLTVNYRYKSFVENIDQYLFLPNIVKDLADFRANNPNGEHVVDLILAADIHKGGQLSLVLDNALNTEYMIIPGLLAAQRKLTMQYRIKF